MIRISQAGACPRRIQLETWGVEGEPLWEGAERAFAEGNLHEPSILEWASKNLPGAPYVIFGQQTEVSIMKDGKEILRGHVDGLATPVTEEINSNIPILEYCDKSKIVLLEAKTLADRGYKELCEKGVKEAHPQYYTQVQLYLHALGLNKAFLIARNKETPKIRLWDNHYEEICYDRNFVEAEIERLAELNEKIEEHIEIEPPYHPDTHWQCRLPWCPYSKLCYPDWYNKKVSAVKREDLLDIVKEYNLITEEIKQLEERQKKLKEQLFLAAQENPITVGQWVVKVEERHSERFDTKLARKELPQELLQKLLKINTYQVLKIEEA